MSDIPRTPRRLACWCGLTCASAVLVLLAAVLALGWRMEHLKFPPLLGNRDENIARAAERAAGDDVVFYVMSDPQRGSGTFRELLSTIDPEEPAFAVICGDLVADPEHTRHTFFSTQIAEANLGFPVLLVPGNHCTAWGDEGDFTTDDYVRTYGPMQFHFAAGGRLFLFLNNAARPDSTGDFLAYAEKTIREHAGKVRDIFIFMHTPPTGLTPAIERVGFSASRAFYDLAARHRVRYVFTGDHHAYWTGTRGETTYVVCGGAGGTLRGTKGRFHHAVRMALRGGGISQTAIVTREETGFAGRRERTVVLHIWPLVSDGPVGWGMTALIAAAAGALLVACVRRLRPEKKGQITQ